MAPKELSSCRFCGTPMTVNRQSPGGGVSWQVTTPGAGIGCPQSPPGNPLGIHVPWGEMPWEDDEARLRRQHRELAEKYRQRREGLDDPRPPGQEGAEWVWGVCTRCHADDLVKGPAGAELCIYCDTLRAMKPPPKPVPVPASPAELARRRRRTVSVVLACLGLVLAFQETTVTLGLSIMCIAAAWLLA